MMTAQRFFFVHKEVPECRFTFLAMTLEAAWGKVSHRYRHSALKFSRKDFTVTSEPEVLRWKRADTITAIVAAARRPMDEAVEVKMMRHKVTRKTCSIFGMPFNYNPDDYEMFTAGWAWMDKNGTTYGTRAATREALVAAAVANRDRNDAEFRATLEAMSDEEVQAQAEYWTKEKVA